VARAAPDLQRASLLQAGRDLVFTVRTAAPLPLSKLDPTPGGGGASRFLCLTMRRNGPGGARRICLGGKRNSRRRAGLQLLNAVGAVTRSSKVAARIKRPEPTKLVLSLRPEGAGLPPHRYRWSASENRRGCQGCEEGLPPTGSRPFRLRPVRAVGCTGGGAALITHGPRDRRVVALTFDDGPSEYTDGFLDVLRDHHAHATFFEIGQEVAGRADVMRRILREGSEIGNHTMHHDFYPGAADMAQTSSVIRAATGFEPCLFRAPGGGVDSAVIDAAGSLGMTTVNWDVDPTDWATPGAAAVYSRVVGAVQPGSIVIMHDGGGNRSGTLAALPGIIDTLRARGYGFATVSELLGHRILYRPYG
jgi:peptidoglycan/xylan/chitin deacetylase (PgdA/CDA1 family)